ncbi:MAG: hypothetical protein LVQ64_02045 [Thermoplasmatales archaeon]|nr:hypothetical protein [Thermoplasmatales archaeon]
MTPGRSLLERPPYDAVRLCATKGAFEAIPQRPTRLDLGRVARRLSASGLDVTDARVILIVRTEPEVTVSQDGRILVKTLDAERAQRSVDDLWSRITHA